MDRSDLAERMKHNYEQVSQTRLLRRMPVAIRLDGRAFHTFTRGMRRPYDEILMTTMQETMGYLCENIQGVVLGYTQSDEITLILLDYQTFKTDAWFDYEVQKLCSISASMATMAFNKFFQDRVNQEWSTGMAFGYIEEKDDVYWDVMWKAVEKGAMFDARCFNIPKEEVTNLIYWRQQDATRNSIQSAGQAMFSFNDLQNKSCSMIQEMLHEQKGVNWTNYPTDFKRGSCCIKAEQGWIIDREIPIFVGEGRDYIEKLIWIGEQ